MKIEEQRIMDALEKSNPWWKEVFTIEFKPREVYNELKKYLPQKFILALVGLRRTGKTTLMLKIAEDARIKMDKTNIIYFSFDDWKGIRIEEVIKSYEKLMRKDVKKGKYLFLFDEIQKIENWEEQLKRLYDLYSSLYASCKFIISGSESLFIRKKSRESLTGRIFEFKVKTLSFKEFLQFKSVPYDNLLLYRENILKEFQNLMISNGFPEIINEEKETAAKYLKENVIGRILYRDIPQIVPIRDPSKLAQIFAIILNDPGQIINLEESAKNLGMSRQTLSLYLEYLEQSFLIRKLYNYSRNTRKTQQRYKKYYPTFITPDIVEKRELFGKVFETIIVNQLNADFFWRDPYKNEVDIIISKPELTAIEVKSGTIGGRDLRPLQHFVKKFEPAHAFVLSYDDEKQIDNIPIIPFYKYLLKKD